MLSLVRQRRLSALIVKAFRLWARAGVAGVRQQLSLQWHSLHGYRNWIRAHGTLNDFDRQAIRAHIVNLRQRPLISILMPTYNSPERWLRRAIETVRNQLYPDWELCIADDASTQEHVRAVLEEYQRLDERIRIVFRDRNGHISAASNSALALATGKFVALLDHDDELPEHALYMVALAIEQAPELNMIYSDEDKIDELGLRFGPYFKPDWNPELLNCQNMISHLGVYRTEVIRYVGGFRIGVEGSQDWDLALRVVEQVPATTIWHIPDVLYHWRAISGSAAMGHEEKSYVASSAQRVVHDHLQRINQSASVEPAFGSFVRVRYPLPSAPPLVSIVLLGDSSKPGELIGRTRYRALEVIPCPASGNGSLAQTLNGAAAQSGGELLCFLDAELVPETEDWLEELAAQAMRPEIGAIGPMQIDAAGNIQDALTALCGATGRDIVSWSFYQGLRPQENGRAGRAALQQNVTALAKGCLLIRAETFREMNGFDIENFPSSLFELDLCLRLVEVGYRNLWTPYARIASKTSQRKGIVGSNANEVARFLERWRGIVNHGPAHSPVVDYGPELPLPAYPRHIDRPWRSEVRQ